MDTLFNFDLNEEFFWEEKMGDCLFSPEINHESGARGVFLTDVA